MVRISYLLKPRWEIFRRHDLRLRTNPDPVLARQMFDQRLKDAKRVQKLRLACFIGIYFSVISATIGTVVAFFGRVPWLENALVAIGGIAGALTIVFIAGVFASTRALNYIEVDLYFYSEESRHGRPREGPIKRSEARIPDANRAEMGQNGEKTRSPLKRRVYRRPPLSSYRP